MPAVGPGRTGRAGGETRFCGCRGERRALDDEARGRAFEVLEAVFGEPANAIREKVARCWTRPPGLRRVLKRPVRASLQDVRGKAVRVRSVIASPVFDQSIRGAVLAASPSPSPPDRSLFERDLVLAGPTQRP